MSQSEQPPLQPDDDEASTEKVNGELGSNKATSSAKPRQPRWPLRLLAVLSLISLLTTSVIVWAYFNYNDEQLAKLLNEQISKQIRGTFKVRRVHWGARAIADLALGTASPVLIEDAEIKDPSGATIIKAARVRAKLRFWSLLAHQEVRFSEVEIVDGRVAVERQTLRGKRFLGIAYAFGPPKPRKQKKKPKPDDVPLMVFEKVSVRNVDFFLKIGSTEIFLPRISMDAKVRIEGDPSIKGLNIWGRGLRAGKGYIAQSGMKASLVGLRAPRARIRGNDILAKEMRVNLQGAPTRIGGRLENVFYGNTTMDLRVRVTRAHPLFSKLLADDSRDRSAPRSNAFSGRAKLSVHAIGPLETPKLDVDIADVNTKLEGIALKHVRGHASFDVRTGSLAVKRLDADVLGGKVAIEGALSLTRMRWQAKVALDKIGLAGVVSRLGGKLKGSIKLSGPVNFRTPSALAVVDLSLRRRFNRRRDYIPARLAVKGTMHLGRIVDLAGLTIKADGNQIRARGSINLAQKRSNVYLTAQLPRLASYLRRVAGLPAVQSGRVNLHVTGRFPRLRATGAFTARGVGVTGFRLRRVRGDIRFRDGVVHVKKLRSDAYGGRISGAGALELFATTLEKPLPRPTLHGRVRIEGLDLSRAGGGKMVQGKANVVAELQGPVESLKGQASIVTKKLVVGGVNYVGARARAGLLKDRISIYEALLPRKLGGGLRVWGDIFFDERLALGVSATDLPLAAIPGIRPLKLPVKAQLQGRLDVSGTVRDPRLAGRLRLGRTIVRGANLGRGWLAFQSTADAIRIKGALLGRLMMLEGFVLTRPHSSLHFKVAIRRFPVHRVVPELKQIGDVTGLVSGNVTVDLDEKRGLTWLNARLSQAALAMRYRPLGRRKAQILELGNREDLLVSFTDGRVHVVTAKMVSSVTGSSKKRRRAKFELSGFIDPKRSDLALRGSIPLELAEFFLARTVKRIAGKADVDVRVTGALLQPKIKGSLLLTKVKVQMPRFERALELPSGDLRVLESGKLQVKTLTLKTGRRRLKVSGAIHGATGILFGKADEAIYDLAMKGVFNMRLLRLFAPTTFAQAAGSALLSVKVRGLFEHPELSGELRLSKRHHAELRPRGLGRTISLRKGHLRLKGNHFKTIKPLEGSYDEGSISLNGEVRLHEGKLIDVFVQLKGRNLPQRDPNVYSAELNADLTLVGDPSARAVASALGTASGGTADAGLLRCSLSTLSQRGHRMMLSGTIDVVDARYVREFDIIKNAVIRPRVSEESKPFWQGSPMLENLGLCLRIRSTGQMKVKNRYATLGLETSMAVTGSLADSRLDGVVRVEEGKFNIPFLKGDYRVDRGEIAFSERKPPTQALLNIDATTNHVDRNGTDYQIKLTLKGSFEGIRIELTSTPALQKGQIIALLATGRTTDQLRQEIQSGGQSPAAGAADAQVKALSSMLLSSILEDPIKKVTGLDLVRLEVGTETLTAKGCSRWKVLGDLELCGEYEKGLLGGYAGRGTAAAKLHDWWKLVGRIERLSTRLDREQENPTRARFELRFGWPLPFSPR
jgi:hypothetical protein